MPLEMSCQGLLYTDLGGGHDLIATSMGGLRGLTRENFPPSKQLIRLPELWFSNGVSVKVDLIFLKARLCCWVHSPSLTWNLKMMVSKRNLLFQGAIFRFHVKLWEGKFWNFGAFFCLWLFYVLIWEKKMQHGANAFKSFPRQVPSTGVIRSN